MSTNPDPTTTYRHNIGGSMADRHDSGPGIIRCGDMPRDIIEFRDLHGQIERKTSFLLVFLLYEISHVTQSILTKIFGKRHKYIFMNGELIVCIDGWLFFSVSECR